jgi:hypothetical protein
LHKAPTSPLDRFRPYGAPCGRRRCPGVGVDRPAPPGRCRGRTGCAGRGSRTPPRGPLTSTTRRRSRRRFSAARARPRARAGLAAGPVPDDDRPVAPLSRDRQLSACGVAAEVGGFDRFERPDRLTAFLGIVPSDSTSAAPCARFRHSRGGHPRRRERTAASPRPPVAVSRARRPAGRAAPQPPGAPRARAAPEWRREPPDGRLERRSSSAAGAGLRRPYVGGSPPERGASATP